MFLGGIFLLIGVALIIKTVFKIDIPIFRFLFACFFIYMGVKMLFGDMGFRHRSYHDEHSAVFSDADFKHKDYSGKNEQGHAEYSVVFGNGKVDLTEANASEPVEINTVFGDMDVFLDAKSLYAIQANSVFGDIRMPDGEKISFGTLKTRVPDQAGEPKFRVRANCVFGQIHFHLKMRDEKTAEKANASAPHASEKHHSEK